MTFWSALTSVGSFWVSLLFTGVKILRHICRMSAKHKLAAKWARLKEDVGEEVAEEDAAAEAKVVAKAAAKKEAVEKTGGTYDARFDDDSDSD